MKKLKKTSIFIVFSIFISVICCPILVSASSPPLYIDYYPTSHTTHQMGYYQSGNLHSTKYNDENYLIYRAHWYWFIAFFFYCSIRFEFDNRIANYLEVDLADNVPEGTMAVTVYYTTGDPTGFGGDYSLTDGTYQHTLAIRAVDYVVVWFYYASFLGGDKYLMVDMIKIRKYYF